MTISILDILPFLFWVTNLIVYISAPTGKGIFAALLFNLAVYTTQTLFIPTPPPPIPYPIPRQALVIINNISLVLLYMVTNAEVSIWYKIFGLLFRIIAICYCLYQHSYLQLAALGFVLFSPLSPISKIIHRVLFPRIFGPSSQPQQIQSKSTDPVSTPNGIFDLSHALINLDPYLNLYGNLGLWLPINYHQLLPSTSPSHNNTALSLPPTPTIPSQSPALIKHYQDDMDMIESYLQDIKPAATHPQFGNNSNNANTSTYFVASRRFALLVYYHAGMVPESFFHRVNDRNMSNGATTILCSVGLNWTIVDPGDADGGGGIDVTIVVGFLFILVPIITHITAIFLPHF